MVSTQRAEDIDERARGVGVTVGVPARKAGRDLERLRIRQGRQGRRLRAAHGELPPHRAGVLRPVRRGLPLAGLARTRCHARPRHRHRRQGPPHRRLVRGPVQVLQPAAPRVEGRHRLVPRRLGQEAVHRAHHRLYREGLGPDGREPARRPHRPRDADRRQRPPREPGRLEPDRLAGAPDLPAPHRQEAAPSPPERGQGRRHHRPRHPRPWAS